MNKQVTRFSWDQRVFIILWLWMALRLLLPWLVSFRLLFEGPGYSWGADYFGHMFWSRGMERPDFLLVPAMAAVTLALLFQLRAWNFRLVAPALVAWLGIFAADAVYRLLVGASMVFQGDTLGVNVDLTIPFFVLQFGMFALALAWWWGVRDLPRGLSPPPMPGHKRLAVKVCAAVVPVQLWLLIGGEPHGTTDAIGVILTLTQGAVLGWALYPGAGYRSVAG